MVDRIVASTKSLSSFPETVTWQSGIKISDRSQAANRPTLKEGGGPGSSWWAHGHHRGKGRQREGQKGRMVSPQECSDYLLRHLHKTKVTDLTNLVICFLLVTFGSTLVVTD